jgi:Family of unknown function (DUF5985)
MKEALNQFLSGAIMMACWVAGLFFLRFWKKTADRLFAIFAVAFWMLAVERLTLVMIREVDEVRGYVYVIRLFAFLLILWAIYDKNRPRRPT